MIQTIECKSVKEYTRLHKHSTILNIRYGDAINPWADLLQWRKPGVLQKKMGEH